MMRRPRIGLLALYVPFYEKIVPLLTKQRGFAEEARRLLEQCGDAVAPGLVETEAQAREAAALFHREAVDAVVVTPLVAVFGALGWTALESLELPVCIWSLQAAAGLSEDYDIGKLIANSGGLGVQALGNTLARAGRRWWTVFSRVGDPLPPKLERFARAAGAASALRRAKFGRVGSVFPQMSDVAMDTGDWPGPPVIKISAAEFTSQYRRQADAAVAARVGQMRAKHTIAGLSDDELTRSARISLALDEIVAEHSLAGGAFNCHGENCLENPEIGVTGCYAVSAQTSRGRPFSCTGDLPTAIAMWMLNELAGVVIYAELDLVDPGANMVVLANGGEGHTAAAATAASLVPNENFAGLHGRGASLKFEPFSDRATLLSFTPIEAQRGYRLVLAQGEMLACRLPRLRVFHAGFRFDRVPAAEAFESWSEAGAPHHVAVAPGSWRKELEMIAAMAGFEAIVIGGPDGDQAET